jgi:hypothetical protein
MKTLPHFLLALAATVAAAIPALAADTPLQRCRAITDNSARLACYDALVPAAFAAPAAVAAVTAPAAAPGAKTAPAAAPAIVTAAAVIAAAPREDNFGLNTMSARKSEPDFIESTIPGAFDGWRPNMRINLANGQVWRIVDDSESYVSGDDLKVKLVKGMFGAIYLEIEGTNKTANVRRVK